MTALNFPSNPIEGQVYNAPNGIRYVYDGVKWVVETTTSTSEAVTNSMQDRVAPMFVDGDHNGISFTYNAATNALTATVTAVNGNQLINGDHEVVLGSDGVLTASGNIKTGTAGGRFIQDASGGASSIRWINMPSNTSEIFARLYTDSGTDSGERARFGLNWLDQNRSGITLTAFDRTGTLVRRNWRFQGDGKLQLPAGGDIIDSSGNSVIGGTVNRSRGPSSVSVVVIASDENADTITVGGDRTELFAVGETVWSTASPEFVPQYFFLVTDVAYNAGLDQTVITLGSSIGSTVYTGSNLYSVINFNNFTDILPGDNITFDFVNDSLVINSTGGSGTTDRLVNGANEVVLDADGILTVPSGGAIQQRFTWTRAVQSNLSTGGAVIWTSLYDYISSVKLTIQLEANETGDATGWHSQVCEAVVASRGYANSVGGPLGEPVMTVYGVTYTSTAPLVTFSVQRNPTTNNIEIVGTQTAACNGSANFRIHSVEMATRD